MSHWTYRKSNNGYGYGQYTALDVLQAKKSCEKRSIRSNDAKKKKVPGWSFSRSSPVQKVVVAHPIRVSAASLGAVSWAQAGTGDQARVSGCMPCPMAKLPR